MFGLEASAWQTTGQEWDIFYFWRWTNWLERLNLLLLALMLAYAVACTISLSHRLRSIQRGSGSKSCSRDLRKVGAELRAGCRDLKSVALLGPYLGLAGTCVGLLSTFRGFDMARGAAVIMIASETGAAILSTAAGIFVGLAATCIHNLAATRVDVALAPVRPREHDKPRSPLTRRFSELAPFGLLAALGLALLMPGLMSLSLARGSKGFRVEIASPGCEADVDRPIVLDIDGAGRISLNGEQQDRNGLADRLLRIYGTRVDRTLYLLADDEVAFQKVANAIDVVRSSAPRLSGITVRLVPSKRIGSPCVL